MDPNPPSADHVHDHGAVHGLVHGPQTSHTLPSINSNEPCSSSMIEEAMAAGACGPPVPYSMSYEIPPPMADFSAPPPYEVATKLPTYDEVQREKSREVELGMPPDMPPQGPGPRPSTAMPMFLAIDTETPDESNKAMLGTDFMFFTAFVVSFLFNWIGFLLLMCFCHTIAARYGALSGFGLSLSKWTLIVKRSSDITDHVWLYWLVMSFGLLICIRAIIHYLNIKRGWQLLSGNPHAQERLLFFY